MADALAAFGLALDGPLQDCRRIFYLWPENVLIFSLWQRLQTQWRTGLSGGRSGLDYAAVLAVIRMQVKREKVQEVFALIQHMEYAALAAWAERDGA